MVLLTSVIIALLFWLLGRNPEEPVHYSPQNPQAPLIVQRDLGKILARETVAYDVPFTIPFSPTVGTFSVDASWTPTPCCVAINTKVSADTAVHSNLRLNIAPRPGTFVYRASVRLRGAEPARIDLEARATVCLTMEWVKEPNLPLKIPANTTKSYTFHAITRHLHRHGTPKIALRLPVKGVTFAPGNMENVAEDDKWRTTKIEFAITFLPKVLDSRGHAEFVTSIGNEEIGRLPIEWEIEPALTCNPRVLVFHSHGGPQSTTIKSLSQKPFRIEKIHPAPSYHITSYPQDESRWIPLTIARLPGASQAVPLEKMLIDTTLGSTEVILYKPKSSEEK